MLLLDWIIVIASAAVIVAFLLGYKRGYHVGLAEGRKALTALVEFQRTQRHAAERRE